MYKKKIITTAIFLLILLVFFVYKFLIIDKTGSIYDNELYFIKGEITKIEDNLMEVKLGNEINDLRTENKINILLNKNTLYYKRLDDLKSEKLFKEEEREYNQKIRRTPPIWNIEKEIDIKDIGLRSITDIEYIIDNDQNKIAFKVVLMPDVKNLQSDMLLGRFVDLQGRIKEINDNNIVVLICSNGLKQADYADCEKNGNENIENTISLTDETKYYKKIIKSQDQFNKEQDEFNREEALLAPSWYEVSEILLKELNVGDNVLVKSEIIDEKNIFANRIDVTKLFN